MDVRGLKRAMLLWTAVLAPTGAWAGWGNTPISTLVANSDLAVVGRLSEIHEHKETRNSQWACAQVLSEGTITVEEAIFGTAKVGQTLRLEWTDGCSNGEDLNHKQHASQRTIWLLRKVADGSVRADYPWRVIRLCAGDLRTVRKVLDALPPAQRNGRLERLASVIKRPPRYECEHHLWEGNW
jgi:hypothetical protein